MIPALHRSHLTNAGVSTAPWLGYSDQRKEDLEL